MVESRVTFHASWLPPKYPVKAFCPQAPCTGLQIGAKAETDYEEKGDWTIILLF